MRDPHVASFVTFDSLPETDATGLRWPWPGWPPCRPRLRTVPSLAAGAGPPVRRIRQQGRTRATPLAVSAFDAFGTRNSESSRSDGETVQVGPKREKVKCPRLTVTRKVALPAQAASRNRSSAGSRRILRTVRVGSTTIVRRPSIRTRWRASATDQGKPRLVRTSFYSDWTLLKRIGVRRPARARAR